MGLSGPLIFDSHAQGGRMLKMFSDAFKLFEAGQKYDEETPAHSPETAAAL